MTLLAAFTTISDDLNNEELEWGRILIFLFLALGISFLCSLLEAIILSVTWSHIEILKKNKDTNTVIETLKTKIENKESITPEDFKKVFDKNVSPN